MNRGFGRIMVLSALVAALCVGGTVMGKEQNGRTRENERYALLEETFRERTKKILEEQGFYNSGVTITWTREDGGVRSYRVEIHHHGINGLGSGERDKLTESLQWEEFCRDVECFTIVYT